jgi:hypothetical protein
MRLLKELGLAATLVASLTAPGFAGHLTPDEDELVGAVLYDMVVKKICGPTVTEKQMADWKAERELVLKEDNMTLEAVLHGKPNSPPTSMSSEVSAFDPSQGAKGLAGLPSRGVLGDPNVSAFDPSQGAKGLAGLPSRGVLGDPNVSAFDQSQGAKGLAGLPSLAGITGGGSCGRTGGSRARS